MMRLGVLFVLGFFSWGCDPSPIRQARAEVENATVGSGPVPVVVELFTSQGCSSCPPADALLADLARRKRSGVQVIPLSFHVDYWDYLGWKDPFSAAEYSARQRWYAALGGSRSVYTPQMVVDGVDAFVGSKRAAAEAALSKAAGVRKQVQLEVALDAPGSVRYRSRGSATDAVLYLALVQKRADNPVRSGENARTTAHHVGVVRELSARDYTGSGEGTWRPKRLNAVSANAPGSSAVGGEANAAERHRVVVFLQERQTGRILGAAMTP